MLKVRQEQLDAFKPQADAAFIARTVEHLREHHSEAIVQLQENSAAVKDLSDEIIHELVRNGVVRAYAYGMNAEASLAAFVVIMFVVAPSFDKHPLIERVLRDASIPPDSRIDQLWERTSEQNWEAVKQSYDASAWSLEAQREGPR